MSTLTWGRKLGKLKEKLNFTQVKHSITHPMSVQNHYMCWRILSTCLDLESPWKHRSGYISEDFSDRLNWGGKTNPWWRRCQAVGGVPDWIRRRQSRAPAWICLCSLTHAPAAVSVPLPLLFLSGVSTTPREVTDAESWCCRAGPVSLHPLVASTSSAHYSFAPFCWRLQTGTRLSGGPPTLFPASGAVCCPDCPRLQSSQ